MKTVLSREYGPKQTRGCFYIFDGDRSILNVKTLELPDKGNAQNVSCIPPGVYPLEKITRPNGEIALHIKGVPGRSEILMHPGNFASGSKVDTQGCVLPGLWFVDINEDGNLDVGDSKKAMDLVLRVLPNKSLIHIL